jgi:hypothetical protein
MGTIMQNNFAMSSKMILDFSPTFAACLSSIGMKRVEWKPGRAGKQEAREQRGSEWGGHLSVLRVRIQVDNGGAYGLIGGLPRWRAALE